MSGERLYVSGDHADPIAVSLPVFSAPLPGINVDLELTQDFECELISFVPGDLNTPHPDYPDFVLAHESEKRDQTAGMVRWTRTYAKVPDSYSEPGGNYVYNFIGMVEAGPIVPIISRERFSLSVRLIIQRDFFLVGAGETYETFSEIPTVTAQRYFSPGDPNLDFDFVADTGVYTNGPTNPSRTAYQALITTDAADADSYSIVVEDSTLTRWIGNIFMRETRRVKAQ